MVADLVRSEKIGEKTLSDKISRNVFDDEFFYKNSQFELLIEIAIVKAIEDMCVWIV